MRRQFLFWVIAIGLVIGTGTFVLAEEAATDISKEPMGETFSESKTIFGDVFKKADIQVTGATAVYSKYMWRGFRLYNDYVVQPSINFNVFKDWNLNVWGSFDASHYEDAPNANEVDTTLTYTHTFKNLKIGSMALKPVAVTLGYIYYDFSGAGTFSKESVLGFGYDTFFSPTLTWYHDHGRESQGGGDGDYLVLSGAKSFDVLPAYGVTLDLSGHVGYNKHLAIRGEGVDVLLSSGFTVPLTKSLNVSPSVNWNAPFGELAKEENGDEYIKRKAEFFWGTTLTYNF
jgi:hypothetical protein